MISVGTLLDDRWRLGERIATGGMGQIHRARDHVTGDQVAIKVLRADVTDGPRRFAQEVAALGRLRHPHIVRLLATGEHDGLPYLVMRFVPGPSLASRLRAEPIGLDELERVGEQVAGALAYAHDHGIVHRDIKPSNVLFDASGDAYVADFGIARVADATSITATGTAVGTASYVAPEQITEAEPVGPPADVYALGLVLLEAATGQRAFPGSPTEAALARLARTPTRPGRSHTYSWRDTPTAVDVRAPKSVCDRDGVP
jgi:eukaryotic-like serine/threonine-protein kinase